MTAAVSPSFKTTAPTPATLCLLTMATGFPFFAFEIHTLSQLLLQPGLGEVTRPLAMQLLRDTLLLVCVVDVLLALWLWPQRRDPAPRPRTNVLIALLHTLALAGMGIATGAYTSPANLPAVTALIVGLALQPRRAVLWGFAFSIVLLGTYQGLVNAGVLPYAPLLVPGTFAGSEPVAWWSEVRAFLCLSGLLAGSGLIFWMFHRLDRQREALVTLSHTDGLTRLSNRRYFMERLELELQRRTRYGFPLSVVYCDADHFKNVNDTYGHQAGDEVLREIGRILAQVRRPMDVAARLGGEEFALILPECDVDKAMIVCERLRNRLKDHEFEVDGPGSDRRRFRVTMSMGAVECRHDTIDALLKQADLNLYEAKTGGRDRVVASVSAEVAP